MTPASEPPVAIVAAAAPEGLVAPASPAPDPASMVGRARYYFLGLMTIVYVVNFIDRQIVNIVAEPVKRDLHLSDSQLGLLTGLAFALVYSVLGIPVARLAERGKRPAILAGCLGIWSLCSALCGLAAGFGQLLLGRMGVALGEAGCTPTSQSLVSDYFPKHQRARALAVLGLGSPIGGLVGLLLGGLLAGAYGWRAAFFLAGLPGLLLVPLVLFTLREPRKALAAAGGPPAPRASLGTTLRALNAKPSYWLINIGSSGFAMFSLAEGAFIASFYLRSHAPQIAALSAGFGLQPIAFLGVTLGLIMGIGGIVGAMLGGIAADRLGARSIADYMWPPALAALLLIPVHVMSMLAEGAIASLSLLFVTSILKAVFIGPTWAATQGLVAPHERATAAALQLIVNNLIGLGVGPLLVGFISDSLDARLGLGAADGLRWSLIALTLVCVPVFFCYWRARRHLTPDSA